MYKVFDFASCFVIATSFEELLIKSKDVIHFRQTKVATRKRQGDDECEGSTLVHGRQSRSIAWYPSLKQPKLRSGNKQ
jgi:hypothetical protein